MSETVNELMQMPTEFIRNSKNLISRCKKPSQKEYMKILRAVGVGFVVMGFIGYFVKLIHIPINNIIVG